MLLRRHLIGAAALSTLASACEAIGLKATIITSTNINGQTSTKVREAKNWGEFESAMGEVATDFSEVAKEVGATTAELAKKLVDVPPQGQVELGQLAPSLKPFEGDVRYDYLMVARLNPSAKYDFKYVQLGIPEYDNFFRAAAEMYATAYQLTETGRHVHEASYNVRGVDVPSEIERGLKKISKAEVDGLLSQLGDESGARRLVSLWEGVAELGVKLVSKVASTAHAGAALVTSAPSQIVNPKLVLHIKPIIRGLEQSVSMVRDTGVLLVNIVA